jgi:uncharacterized protein (DUF983 family)
LPTVASALRLRRTQTLLDLPSCPDDRRIVAEAARDLRLEESLVKRSLIFFLRALRLRCPNCGCGDLFLSWFDTAPSCPGCGLQRDRGEEGYFLGAMAINLVVSESIPIIGIVLTWVLTYPRPPVLAMTVGGMIGAVVLPLLFFPLSRTLWLALDLSFRPIDAQEIDRQHVD